MDLGNSSVKDWVDLLIKNLVDELVRVGLRGNLGELLREALSDGMDLALNEVSIELDLSLGSSRDDLDEDSEVVTVFGLDINREIN